MDGLAPAPVQPITEKAVKTMDGYESFIQQMHFISCHLRAHQ